jgi:DNA mismatch repair ATPase MutS
VIITGANQGGKSTFLRSVGLSQLMMQAGMFVPAQSFCSELFDAVFTHDQREEDVTMKRGKLDEELNRMNHMVDTIGRNSMLLLNEAFAATNEREGSEIARQITSALVERGIKVFFVTHLYQFARGVYDKKMANAIFLRAERRADGARTFRVVEGEPLQTSYGIDLYKKVFSSECPRNSETRVQPSSPHLAVSPERRPL